DYLQTQNWRPMRRICGGRLMGLCPLHLDRKPSFLVDPLKNLFYCYGCGRGGDLIRFVELYHDVSFGEALALLRRSARVGSLLSDVARFSIVTRRQLRTYSSAGFTSRKSSRNSPLAMLPAAVCVTG